MIDDNRWFFASGILNKMKRQSDRFGEATKGLMIAPESPLLEPMFQLEESLIATLSFLLEDDSDNINWFVYECDYGRSPNRAGRENDMRLIDSLDRLRWLIELGCKD